MYILYILYSTYAAQLQLCSYLQLSVYLPLDSN